MRRNNRIVVTQGDAERLRAVLGSRGGSVRDREHILDLRDELEQARVVAEHEIPADVVTLRSKVRVRDRETGALSDYTVVSPAHANLDLGQISVLAPLGTALLGYREGDEFDWQMPGGVRRLQIERVRQPRLNPHRLRSATSAGDASPMA
ncbi:MAG TPA: GreA/GreB family elongation factor [Povalibacter sp.]